MKDFKDTRFLVTASLFAALTFIATAVFKFQTPTFGYIHLGDAFVLLSGIMLGPAAGGLAAATGSMLSDLLGGYAVWAPGTFLIKFLTAFTAGAIYRKLRKRNANCRMNSLTAVISGIAAEAVMVAGYFLYNILMIALVNSGAGKVTFFSALTQSAAEIPFNVVQGVFGTAAAVLVLPVISKIPAVKNMSLTGTTLQHGGSNEKSSHI